MVDRACLPDKDSEHPPPGTRPNQLADPNQVLADRDVNSDA